MSVILSAANPVTTAVSANTTEYVQTETPAPVEIPSTESLSKSHQLFATGRAKRKRQDQVINVLILLSTIATTGVLAWILWHIISNGMAILTGHFCHQLFPYRSDFRYLANDCQHGLYSGVVSGNCCAHWHHGSNLPYRICQSGQ